MSGRVFDAGASLRKFAMGVGTSKGCVEACGDQGEHARQHARATCAATCDGNGRTCAKDAVAKATLLKPKWLFSFSKVLFS
jgi:hypothetical protein